MKNFYLKLMLGAVMAIVAMPVNAAHVDADAAQSLASKCLKSQAHAMMLSPQTTTLRLAHVEKSSHDPACVDFYVFNSGEEAYVIVSGDDRTEGILGYGHGSLDMDNLPCNVRWWLDQYKEQMEWLYSHPEARVGSNTRRSPADGITIEPLLTCQWSQSAPYNDQCPEDENGRCVTGCVATAMAQVMYFWKYPETLPALPGYSFNYFNMVHVEVPSLPGTVLDWDNMLDNYSTGYSAEQGAAVAALMRYCGQACFMEYSSEGSGSSDLNQLMAFKQFGYNPNARVLCRDDYEDDQWHSLVISELQAGHPVPYDGRGDSGGHAFVVDGCHDGKFHVNWGWGGAYDGYFELEALKGSGFDFRFGQSIKYGICPDNGNVSEPELACDFEVDGIYYLKNGDEATVTFRDCRFGSYSGVVEVPEQVEWEGKTYQVTAVGDYAFAYSPSLTALRLPSVNRIGEQVIDGCVGLEELRFGGTVESIGMNSYFSCPQLKWVDVEDLDAWVSVEFDYASPHSFGLGLHYQGEPVTHLVVHEGAKIGSNALTGLMSLEHLILENGVKSIGDYAFYNCGNLMTVVIGDGLERVGVAAFYGCNNLNSVQFNGRVGNIDASAFYGISSLESLTLPTAVDSIGYAAFAYCDNIPALELHDVDYMDEFAFYGCTSMEDVSFLGNVGTIDNYAFYGCTSISRVNICDLKSWCGIDFVSSTSNPMALSGNLFVNHVRITDLVIPDGVQSIGQYAFAGGEEFNSVTIPSSVSSVGTSAFVSCSGMKYVNVNDLAKWCSIDFENAAANPLSLAKELRVDNVPVTDLVVPEGVSSIGRYGFVGASTLNSVTIPASVKSVGLSAFKGCGGLTRVTANDLSSWCGINFANIEANPLNVVHHLEVNGNEVTELVVPDDVEAIGDFAFATCEGIISVATGDHLKTIGNYAFQKCKNLVKVSVGDQVSSIGEKAFNSCTSLTGVTLGRGVEHIGSKAFYSSMIINDITCKASVPPVVANKDAFSSGIYKKATVTVPMESLEAYASAGVWSEFDNVVGANLNYSVGDVNRDGEVNIADINTVVNSLLSGDNQGGICDVNGDGEVNVADINAIIAIINHVD
ncbi:MAG: leucine-rich repeat protein [Muribaculaceae bacterium]|nr:leucine-rich repeat protein [Muribaculaceae bacterium]